MLPPRVLKLLRDMQDSATDIAGFAAGRTLDDYARDKQFRMAVERGFEIVGEALAQLSKLDPDTASKITDSRAIIGFRNVLIHGYGHVDHARTWDIVQTTLPVLRREPDELLA